MPSLKPNMLRGVAWRLRGRRRAAEPELAPAHRDDPEAHPHQVAHRVHRHLRVVGAGLDDDVAARARRVEVVAEEGRAARAAPRAVGRPGRTGRRTARAVADRHGEVARREVERLAGVLRHVPRPAADDAARRRLGAQRHPLGGRGPAGQQVAQRVAVVGDDVERHEVQPVLGRRGDAGLPLTAEGHDAVVRGIRLRRLRRRPAGRRGVGQPGGRAPARAAPAPVARTARRVEPFTSRPPHRPRSPPARRTRRAPRSAP